jgi:hypothetical protein
MMKSLVKLLDILHMPLIVIGVYFAAILCSLGLGVLFIHITLAICHFIKVSFNLTGGEALFWAIYGVPMFAGLVGLVWWGVRRLLITDSLVDYLEEDDDTGKTGHQIKSAAVK